MGLWVLPDGSYVTANWNLQTVSRFGPYPQDKRIWQTSLSVSVGAVAADDTLVYAMPQVCSWSESTGTGQGGQGKGRV